MLDSCGSSLPPASAQRCPQLRRGDVTSPGPPRAPRQAPLGVLGAEPGRAPRGSAGARRPLAAAAKPCGGAERGPSGSKAVATGTGLSPRAAQPGARPPARPPPCLGVGRLRSRDMSGRARPLAAGSVTRQRDLCTGPSDEQPGCEASASHSCIQSLQGFSCRCVEESRVLRSPWQGLASSPSPASLVPALVRTWENPQPCRPSQEPWELSRADKRCLVSGYIPPGTLPGH